ncbi:hypothetical protein J6590_018690 [Homalodisca vitripennis]|nr:hypothetical protein J6590_018690 [Homalodisca vitripennis]
MRSDCDEAYQQIAIEISNLEEMVEEELLSCTSVSHALPRPSFGGEYLHWFICYVFMRHSWKSVKRDRLHLRFE